jgi:hypothetical protein
MRASFPKNVGLAAVNPRPTVAGSDCAVHGQQSGFERRNADLIDAAG